jgi:acetyltransferase-like isoleucine patch superfamily enzyme
MGVEREPHLDNRYCWCNQRGLLPSPDRQQSADIKPMSSLDYGSPMIYREPLSSSIPTRIAGAAMNLSGEVVRWGWERARTAGAIGPRSRIGKRFGSFGEGSVVCFPSDGLVNVESIHIGAGTLIGPNCVLSAGWGPGQVGLDPEIVSIGDRCLIGRGSSIIGHRRIEIGDDVWTGHHVAITDMNHGYELFDVPISRQNQPEDPVKIGAGSWLGHRVVVLPGVTIGKHVSVGAGSVVTHDLPDYSVAVGSPARVIRLGDPEVGWHSVH